MGWQNSVQSPNLLQTLRQMQAAAQRGEALLESAASQDESVSAGDESECSNPERRKLRRKLDELQDKKVKMERLLGELQTLRQYRHSNGKYIACVIN